MVNTRKQLFVAVAMLLVAALALGSSTYAWFVANRTVTVEQMKFSAEAVDTLQIATSTTAWEGEYVGTTAVAPTLENFKSLVTLAEINALYNNVNSGISVAKAFNPASTIDVANFYTSQSIENQGWTNDLKEAKTFLKVENITSNTVKAIPLYFRSNQAKMVKLSQASTVARTTSLEGNGIETAVRVAIVQDGAVKLIWAPAAATTHVNSSINTTNATNGGVANGITKAVSGTANVADMSLGDSVSLVQAATLSQDYDVVQLEANTTSGLVMVYVWLEGCDEDCVAEIASQEFSVNLQFKIEE